MARRCCPPHLTSDPGIAPGDGRLGATASAGYTVVCIRRLRLMVRRKCWSIYLAIHIARRSATNACFGCVTGRSGDFSLAAITHGIELKASILPAEEFVRRLSCSMSCLTDFVGFDITVYPAIVTSKQAEFDGCSGSNAIGGAGNCFTKTDGPAVVGVGEWSECVDLSVLPVPADDHVTGARRATGVVRVAAPHRDAGHVASGDKGRNRFLMKSRDVYVLLRKQQLTICLAASQQGFSSASFSCDGEFTDGARRSAAKLLKSPRNRRCSSLCHTGLPALRCHVFSCGHAKSDTPIWQ